MTVPTLRLSLGLPFALAFALSTTAFALLLHEQVIDLFGIHVAILLIKQTNQLACYWVARHRHLFLVGVGVLDLQVDDIVHRIVGYALVGQMLPHSQVAIRLVHGFVYYQESKLLIVQRFHELTPVGHITTIGRGGFHRIAHSHLAHHEHAREQAEVGVLHQAHMRSFNPLFGCQFHHRLHTTFGKPLSLAWRESLRSAHH